jgi:uncharacterized lipoprotein YmbA
LWTWLAVAVLVTACGAPPKKDTFYRLPDAGPAAAADTAHGGPLLHVPPFSANGLVSERALVYARADGTSLEQYNYHFWVDSPRLMLQQALSAALASGLDARVVAEPMAGAYSVRGRIERLERAAGKGPVARVELGLAVHAPAGGPAVFSRSYARALDPMDESVAASAAALGKASQDILAQFVSELQAQWGALTAVAE